ncbi:Uma2 family endonuclease [Leptolyngbya sp. NK1-12]|uniref:Uma2 family endonuclease n=1 Tax=Leptolyngbya sp. NK1-12 TaxID=2547451 RepID=A0AA96WSJ8_9CYAN|nr:Uma2 family endonuclease [Leptolyngbya sp. NK1-12]WNZ22017.1 Uma2 family endonuclease [Leptolyngbya sp. NK1-12]
MNPISIADIPPLESGDHLTSEEFERRYQAMPDLKKAELIEGVVYVPAALRFRSHGKPHGHIMTWLGTYEAVTPGVEIGDNPTVRLDPFNTPQPDAVLLISENAGGQARISADDYIEGAPELVIEVAASSSAIDLYEKKRAYCRNHVQEYLVWQVLDQKFDWFLLHGDDYASLEPDADEILKSATFPGLWLASAALLSGDMAHVLAVLQQGLHSPEHTDFVKRLQQI